MKRETSQRLVAIGMLLVILVGMLNYFSWENVIKPIGWQLVYGYSKNTMPKDATPHDKLVMVRNKIEEKSNEIFLKEVYINLHTLIQVMMDQRVIEDAKERVVKLNNGYLSFLYQYNSSASSANSLIALNAYVQENKMDLLYIQAPFKISKYDSQLPIEVEESSNANMDAFLAEIEGRIDFIDLRKEMYDAGLNQYDYFFKTDHHWTPEGGFWAWGRIAQELTEKYGFEIDPTCTDLDNYKIEKYENWFLGSQGKRVGPIYGGVDDISIITPKFDTNFSLSIPSKEINRAGSFEETMLFYEHLEPKDYYNKTPYSTYSGGDFSRTVIRNHNTTSDKKVLLIRDSFACVVSPFFALGVKELHVLDLRFQQAPGLKEYIDVIQPDLIVLLYSSTSIRESETFFNFGDGTW